MLSCRHFLRFLSHASRAVASIFLLLSYQSTRKVLAQTELLSSVHLSGPRGVSVDTEGNVLVASPGSNSIVVFNSAPTLESREDEWASSLVPVGVIKGTKSPPLRAPCDVVVDSAGRAVVADTGNQAVKIYYPPIRDPRSRVQTIGGRIRRRFSSPEGVAVDERHNIIVFDTGNGEVKVLSPDEKLLAVISSASPAPMKEGHPPISAPFAGCYLGGGYLAIADRNLPTYSLWRYNPASPSSETCRFIGYGPPAEDALNFYVRDIAYDGQRGLLAYIGSNFPLRSAAFLYFQATEPDDPGRLVAPQASCWRRVPLVGWLRHPSGLAFSPGGDLYITDAASGSLQKISRETFGVLGSPVETDAQRTGATLKYFSIAEVPTLLEYGAMPDHAMEIESLEFGRSYSDPEKVFAHTARLPDLLASTRYAYRYVLSRDFFRRTSGKPPRNFSTTMCIATQPAPRTIGYLNFPLTVLLDSGPLPPPQVQKLRSQLEEQLEAARLFFWVNSRMTCNVKPNLIVTAGRLEAPFFPLKKGGGEVPRLNEFLSGLKKLVRNHARRDLSSLRNLFIIYPAGALDEKVRNLLPITCGLDQLGGAVSIFTHAEDNTWFFIAEFQKHLSIMHLASGREATLSSLLNDPDLDQSSVLWDSKADLLRALGRQAWLSNRYGVFKLTADEDQDGIPDDEPDCPLDEKRFGTNPRAKDTDGDGVSDLNEVLASRWAGPGRASGRRPPRAGGFPIVSVRPDGTRDEARGIANCVAPSPSAADTDGDGVKDSDDRNPLCRLDDFIRKLNITLDGEIKAGEWENAPSMRIVDPEFTGILRVAWNKTHLCFSLISESSKNPPSIRIRIDGTGDGFLRGSDNLAIVFEPTDSGSFNVRSETDASGFVMGASPFSSLRPALPPVFAAWSPAGNKPQVEIGFPRSPDLGLNLSPGEEIGFDIELRPPKSAIWLRVFQPLTLFRGLLVEPPGELEMPD